MAVATVGFQKKEVQRNGLKTILEMSNEDKLEEENKKQEESQIGDDAIS